MSIDTIATFAPLTVLMSRFDTVAGLLTALICATAFEIAVSDADDMLVLVAPALIAICVTVAPFEAVAVDVVKTADTAAAEMAEP
ncbi:hypothetical protein NL518_26990, partial [Klebsiella pneumoniae]|nr:hypothetical protein [Klebsiella pneumoniae]